jgi:protein-glutamine gamma-glutamyltransferase
VSRTSSTPPRLLIGVALIFWGLMTDRPLTGVSLAVVMEAAHWTKLRWDFREQAFLRAWHLSALLISVRLVLILVDGGRFIAVPRLLGWLPLLLAPVQFTQSYGLMDRMPLTTFSLFARRRMQRNLALGLPVNPIMLNFGAIYLPMTVLACTLGEKADNWWFLTGIIVISGWAALAASHATKRAISLALVLAGAMALGGQIGLKALYSHLIKGRDGEEEGGTLSHYRSAIGSRGEVKQSTQILWRMKTLQGPTPALLHTSIFNNYDRSVWSYRVPPEQFGTISDFDDLKSIDSPDGLAYYLANSTAGHEAVAAGLPKISLRGAVKRNSALPVPGSITALGAFNFEGQERNAIGTIRVFSDQPISDGVELWDGLSSPEKPPWNDTQAGKTPYMPDLRVPPDETAAIRDIVQQLNLKALPLQEKLSTLKQWFATHFRYTRYLSIDANNLIRAKSASALTTFLTKNRAGHCEYFATATTLILREAGVPARYAIGFAVKEYDPRHAESVIRGTHGHAWCRVWDDEHQRWFDFDTTPASWLSEETQKTPWHQGLQDWMQRQQEDFFLWRNRPGNGLLIGSIMTGIGLIGALIIARNLWRSRRKIEDSPDAYQWKGPAIRTPLHELEPAATKLLGPRPTGLPLGSWMSRLPAIEGLNEAIALHQRLRFDPDSKPASAEPRLTELVKQLRTAILLIVRKRP